MSTAPDELGDDLSDDFAKALDEAQRAPAVWRFQSSTSSSVMVSGRHIPFNTAVPSGYGWWPFARAAAKSGGVYVFYPSRGAERLDVLPRQSELVDALAPELVPEPEFIERTKRDPALSILLDAQRAVMADTPWSDSIDGAGAGTSRSWCAFLDEGRNRLDARWSMHQKPVEMLTSSPIAYASAAEARRGRERLRRLASAYDEAIRTLSRERKELAAKQDSGLTRRGDANLRLSLFWFEMSRFHIEALDVFLQDAEEWFRRGRTTPVAPCYVPCIRLSDCLDGYTQHTTDPGTARELGLMYEAARGVKSSVLRVDIMSRRYRSKRQLTEVLEHIDARLVTFACRMVDAASEVMEHEGHSAWGWIVYYSEALCFTATELSGPTEAPDSGGSTPPMPGRPGTTGSDGSDGPSTEK